MVLDDYEKRITKSDDAVVLRKTELPLFVRAQKKNIHVYEDDDGPLHPLCHKPTNFSELGCWNLPFLFALERRDPVDDGLSLDQSNERPRGPFHSLAPLGLSELRRPSPIDVLTVPPMNPQLSVLDAQHFGHEERALS